MAAFRGYKLILTVPDSVSLERKIILRAFGAELVLTNKCEGIAGASEKAKEIIDITPHGFLLDQSTNPANPRVCFR